MTGNTPEAPRPGSGRAEMFVRMHAIAAGLQAGGLDARVHDTMGVLDIRATLHNPGSKDTDVTIDQDGYVTVSFWNDPGATPAQIIDVIGRVISSLSGPP